MMPVDTEVTTEATQAPSTMVLFLALIYMIVMDLTMVADTIIASVTDTAGMATMEDLEAMATADMEQDTEVMERVGDIK